jgi:hypothetical protein
MNSVSIFREGGIMRQLVLLAALCCGLSHAQEFTMVELPAPPSVNLTSVILEDAQNAHIVRALNDRGQVLIYAPDPFSIFGNIFFYDQQWINDKGEIVGDYSDATNFFPNRAPGRGGWAARVLHSFAPESPARRILFPRDDFG